LGELDVHMQAQNSQMLKLSHPRQLVLSSMFHHHLHSLRSRLGCSRCITAVVLVRCCSLCANVVIICFFIEYVNNYIKWLAGPTVYCSLGNLMSCCKLLTVVANSTTLQNKWHVLLHNLQFKLSLDWTKVSFFGIMFSIVVGIHCKMTQLCIICYGIDVKVAIVVGDVP